MTTLKKIFGLLLVIPMLLIALFHDPIEITLNYTLLALLTSFVCAFVGSGLMYGFSGYKAPLSFGDFDNKSPVISNTMFMFIVSLTFHFFFITLLPNF